MAWVKLDDSMPHHPKVVAAGPLAFALDVAALAYANRFDTKGRIDADALAAVFPGLPQPRKHAATLVRVGRWHEVDGGWQIHNYYEYQPTPEDRAALSKKRADAGRKGGKASAQQRQEASNGEASCFDGAEAKSKPVPGQPPEPGPVPSPASSSSQPTTSSGGDPIGLAAEILVNEETERRAHAGELNNPEGYRRSRLTPVRREHEQAWREMLDLDPELTGEELADAVRAPSLPTKREPVNTSSLIPHVGRRDDPFEEPRRYGEPTADELAEVREITAAMRDKIPTLRRGEGA